jgi:hypothetical protein
MKARFVRWLAILVLVATPVGAGGSVCEYSEDGKTRVCEYPADGQAVLVHTRVDVKEGGGFVSHRINYEGEWFLVEKGEDKTWRITTSARWDWRALYADDCCHCKRFAVSENGLELLWVPHESPVCGE